MRPAIQMISEDWPAELMELRDVIAGKDMLNFRGLVLISHANL